jgi:hypothetical protein
MSTKLYYKITATVFAVIGVFHAIRVIQGWEAEVGGFEVPISMSVVAVLIAG